MAGSRFSLVLSLTARADIAAIHRYTIRIHGREAAKAYGRLFRQAFRDIRDDPLGPESRLRPEIGPSVRSYHISLSRVRAGSAVKRPRHFIFYSLLAEDRIDVSRVLHDSQDFARHFPDFGESSEGA